MATKCTSIQKSLGWCQGTPELPGVKRRRVSPDLGLRATGTTSTTINVEATDEVPAPFFVGTLETEDGDIDCSGNAA